MKSKKKTITTIEELQMITGVVSTDLNYLYYLLIKDGTYFDKLEREASLASQEGVVESFEDWFNSL